MKLSINRNIVWCDLFVNRLSQLGVRYACISPGSRSTSLTIAFATNKSISVFPIVDERSSAFFALGLAKKSNSPVAIVTTSGTAVAELYPAIIEAYYQRVPLIICTADRPHLLRNRGANQTINQNNIYKNHICHFADAGLPDLKNLSTIKKIAEDAIRHSCLTEKGPVHINFPFEKPFEPKSYTDKIEVGKIEKIFADSSFEVASGNSSITDYDEIAKKLWANERGIVIVGFNNYQNDFAKLVTRFSAKFGYPIYIDGSTSLRFGRHSKENVIENLTAFMRAKDFQNHFDPEIIIQFGGAPTSNVLLEFFKNSRADKILVNEFGDKKDPSFTAKTILEADPSEFIESILQRGEKRDNRDSCWLIDYHVMNSHAEKLKDQFIKNAKFSFEGRIVTELLDSIPENSNLMISNSLPIRDTDFFASVMGKKVNVYTNRGASGIDGITSTALGMAKSGKEKSFLITGDLAFYHDLNGLHNAIKFKIPLTVILVNNCGGGIFESLPISGYKDVFKENFFTPLNADFKKLVEAYGGNYHKINSWKDFKERVILSSRNKKLTVLEIQTDAKESKLRRQNYWNAVSKRIVQFINEIKS